VRDISPAQLSLTRRFWTVHHLSCAVLQDPLYSEALQVQREVLGPDHPDTLLSMNNMAVLCYRKRDFSAAKTLMREAASRRKRVLVRYMTATPLPTRHSPH
jgi:hypothetical protein